MSNQCHICPFVEEQQEDSPEVLLQSDHWNVVLDRNQEYLGKSFVTARMHRETLSDLALDEWQDLHVVIARMESAVKKAFHADVLNWSCLMNNAVKSGDPTHVHWHLHPRFLNGAIFRGEDFPDDTWPRRREKQERLVSDDMFQSIASAIKEAM